MKLAPNFNQSWAFIQFLKLPHHLLTKLALIITACFTLSPNSNSSPFNFSKWLFPIMLNPSSWLPAIWEAIFGCGVSRNQANEIKRESKHMRTQLIMLTFALVSITFFSSWPKIFIKIFHYFSCPTENHTLARKNINIRNLKHFLIKIISSS